MELMNGVWYDLCTEDDEGALLWKGEVIRSFLIQGYVVYMILKSGSVSTHRLSADVFKSRLRGMVQSGYYTASSISFEIDSDWQNLL